MKLLAVLLPIVLYLIITALSFRDIKKAGEQPQTGKWPNPPKFSFVTAGLWVIFSLVLSYSAYVFTGEISTSITVGLLALLVSIWLPIRRKFLYRFIKKWVPKLPRGELKDDKARLEWENRSSDLFSSRFLKILPRVGLVLIISDIVLIAAIFLLSKLIGFIK